MPLALVSRYSLWFFSLFLMVYVLICSDDVNAESKIPKHIAGVVLDELKETPIPNALISVSEDGNWLYDLRTSQDGWFEAPKSIGNTSYEDINIAIIKQGYKTKLISLNSIDSGCREFFCKVILKPDDTKKQIYNSPKPVARQYTGYIGELETNYPIVGARIKVMGKADKNIADEIEILDVSYSRSNGFYTLSVQPESSLDSIEVTRPGYYFSSTAGGYVVEESSRVLDPIYLRKMDPVFWSIASGLGLDSALGNESSGTVSANVELQIYGKGRFVRGSFLQFEEAYSDPILIPYAFISTGVGRFSQGGQYVVQEGVTYSYVDEDSILVHASGDTVLIKTKAKKKVSGYVSAGLGLMIGSSFAIKAEKFKIFSPVSKKVTDWHFGVYFTMFRFR